MNPTASSDLRNYKSNRTRGAVRAASIDHAAGAHAERIAKSAARVARSVTRVRYNDTMTSAEYIVTLTPKNPTVGGGYDYREERFVVSKDR